MAWLGIIIFIYEDTQEHVILLCLDPFLSYTPYTQEKNHLDNAGIKPGLPASQASALFIMPWPLRQTSRP